MSAGLNRSHTKTTAARTPTAKAAVAQTPKELVKPNPVWQSLATFTPGLQAKLAVSQPNDRHEVEADRIADRVMRMQTSALADRLSFSSFNSGSVQRKCDGCKEEDEEKVQRKESEDGPSSLHAAAKFADTVQRQAGDPFSDPLGGEKKEEKKPEDPKTKRALEACPDLCTKFPPIEIAPDVFVALCDDTLTLGSPDVRMVGCTPNRQGRLGFFAGSPGWQLPSGKGCNLETCKVTGPGSKSGSTAGIEIGYIQTVEKALSGGVYFQRDSTGKWVWAGNKWWCVQNARDGEAGSVAPWYGAPGNFGPKPFGDCPVMTDTPNVPLDARQNTKQIGPGAIGGGNPLRRMRIDGIFHLWLVAKLPAGTLVFIHHWSIQCWVVAELTADDADPCNKSQWQTMNMNKLITSGPGQGSATPVLTGDVANKKQVDCSTK